MERIRMRSGTDIQPLRLIETVYLECECECASAVFAIIITTVEEKRNKNKATTAAAAAAPPDTRCNVKCSNDRKRTRWILLEINALEHIQPTHECDGTTYYVHAHICHSISVNQRKKLSHKYDQTIWTHSIVDVMLSVVGQRLTVVKMCVDLWADGQRPNKSWNGSAVKCGPNLISATRCYIHCFIVAERSVLTCNGHNVIINSHADTHSSFRARARALSSNINWKTESRSLILFIFENFFAFLRAHAPAYTAPQPSTYTHAPKRFSF